MPQHSSTSRTPAGEPEPRFTLPHGRLTAALRTAAVAVPVRPALPVLGGVLIQAEGSTVTVHAFDYEVTATVTLTADVESNGCVCLDLTELKQALSAAVAGMTRTAAARTAVTVSGGELSTSDMSASVTRLPAHEYPRGLPVPPPTFAVDGPEFFGQLARVLPAAASDDTLPQLTAVQVTIQDARMRLEATDRYRRAQAELSAAPLTPEHPTGCVPFMLPAHALRLISKRVGKHTGPVTLGVPPGEPVGCVTLTVGTTEITMRTYAGEHPTVEAIMAAPRVASLELPRAALMDTVKELHAVNKARRKADAPAVATWSADGAMALGLIPDEDEDEAAVPAPIEVTRLDPAQVKSVHGRTLALNTGFLLDALRAFTTDTITLHLEADHDGQFLRPALFTEHPTPRAEAYTHLLGPARL